jgi:RNA polymerase sigma factor (sigma-70 family)
VNKDEERSLIAKAQAGDMDARNTLIEHLMPWLRSKCVQRSRRYRDVDDMVQFVAIAVIRSIQTFDLASDVRLSTYLAHRVRGAIADYWRGQLPVGAKRPSQGAFGKQMTQRADFHEWVHPIDEIPQLRVEWTDAEDFVERLCESLGEYDGELIRLRFLEDLPMLQIARRLGCSESRVSQRLAELMPRCKERIESYLAGKTLAARPIVASGRKEVIMDQHTEPVPRLAPASVAMDVRTIAKLIVAAKDSDLESIDATIAEVEQSLSGLRELRKVFAKRLGHVETKKPARLSNGSAPARLDAQILDYLAEHGSPADVTAIGRKLGKPVQAVNMSVTRSPLLQHCGKGKVEAVA